MRGSEVGNYAVTGLLGEGGMGKVYLAEHKLMGKRAAVKVLLPELTQNEELVKRFFNEANATARVNHPGIIHIYDLGVLESGSAYIVMELLEGEPLSALLGRQAPLPVERAARLGNQMADTLAAAHEADIVHRDLKPDNIFVVPDSGVAGGERVKILDFGIAKLGGDTSTTFKTRTGAVLGTPTYMSPEQCRGAGQVDWRSDIYSVGCILFGMLAGRPPFLEDGVGGMISAHMTEPAPPLSQFSSVVPEELAAVIAQMLEKKPENRPQGMREVGAFLASFSEFAGAARLPSNPPESARVAERISASTTPAAGREQVMTPAGAGTEAHTGPAPGATPGDRHADGRHGSASTTLGGATGERAAESSDSSQTWIRVGLGISAVLALGAVVSAFALAGGGDDVAADRAGALDVDADQRLAETTSSIDAGHEPASSADAAPPDAAPAPQHATVAITSRPSGALVRTEDGTIVGETPLEHEIERTGEAVAFVVRAPGYQTERVEIVADRDREEAVALVRERRRPAATSQEPAGETSEQPAAAPQDNGGKADEEEEEEEFDPFGSRQ